MRGSGARGHSNSGGILNSSPFGVVNLSSSSSFFSCCSSFSGLELTGAFTGILTLSDFSGKSMTLIQEIQQEDLNEDGC
ncbi:hypothetical protein AtNW77_Chr1g0071871 [Arabidopsis thaliana]|uniref:Uncharacterized protein n=3 Tax=Arabidopsis thaliana TaxID=3702 RepID=Q1G3D4_ARATH|nr:unknown protein [Arabidopsis thaliana]CAD5316849.1 unnamed protein product [Arabidopsis thaliana]